MSDNFFAMFPALFRGMMQPQARLWAALFGASLHLLAFRVGEWDLYTVKLVLAVPVTVAALTGGFMKLVPDVNNDIWTALGQATALESSVLGGVYASMIIYRAAFHRLNIFPGPFAARLSNFWITSKGAKNMDTYLQVQKLHEKYGDVVRVGPSELSILHQDAIGAIHSNQTKCRKGPWYNILHPLESLQMIRRKENHIRRRKTWDCGFSARALRDYEPKVSAYADLLIRQIDARLGQPMNMTDWFNFYSFDVMGDLAFGKSFNMLRDGIKHYFMNTLHADMVNVGLLSHLPWLFPIFKAIPVLNAENKKFWEFVTGLVEERIQHPPEQPDVFSWLLEDYQALPNPTKQDKLNLYADAHLIVVAGSDTTAATLTCLFFELARHPEALRILREEIDNYNADEGSNQIALSKLPYLQACIDETLRLHPPVPSGVQRFTSAEGLQIGNFDIPGNTIVQVPSHTLHRDARFFEDPDEFHPERWTSQRQMVKNASVFQPFSAGRYSCVGKQLGLMELRAVTSELVSRYNFSYALTQNVSDFQKGKVDAFTLACAPLELIFTARKVSD